ncbi:phosphotransferase [Corynebacterium riegelii]|uniref:phosphotransferase n=1 Tax=Corynebacterium riegelii TaxID=156976 RepID=UPI0023F82C30|nr:phosphotransferase [Corynebacterium riegelii]
MIDITKERFFGSKAGRVVGGGVDKQKALGPYTWEIVTLDLGTHRESYQILHDGTRDILATTSGAQTYVEHMAQLGQVHGQLRGGEVRPMGAEQSNTNLIVGNTIVKVFRKLEDGLNPDVELLSRIENKHVAKVTGYVTLDGRTLAMQQELVGGTDGFVLATAGALGAADARALGEAIGSVHASLASEFGVEKRAGSAIRAQLDANLDAYLERASVLREFEPGLRALYAALDTQDVDVQRVHGDLHLGQTLFDASLWHLIDFEGEPARPLAERRRKDVALRDVAGMVRSFGYARAVGELSQSWESEMRDALLAGYGELDGTLDEALLAAYVADKAAYEVVYEANNRPDWVDIPLTAIKQLLSI